MNPLLKPARHALLLLALATPALAGPVTTLDHDGHGRIIDIENRGSDLDVISRGNGGSLDALVLDSDDIDIFHLGGDSDARVKAVYSEGTSVFIGHCPEGMSPEPVKMVGKSGGLVIPRCR